MKFTSLTWDKNPEIYLISFNGPKYYKFKNHTFLIKKKFFLFLKVQKYISSVLLIDANCQ